MSAVYLKDKQTGRLIEATLLSEMTADQVIAAYAMWRPSIERRRQELITQEVPGLQWPQHLHWDWERKARAVDGLLSYRLVGLECDGTVQGMMLAALDGKLCRIAEQEGKPLVYVHFLSSAPWNSTAFTPEPRFGLVGSVLMAAAIQLSRDHDYRGRIGLHSLPQSEPFYHGCGMTDLGEDPNGEFLRYFEMTQKQAEDFLK